MMGKINVLFNPWLAAPKFFVSKDKTCHRYHIKAIAPEATQVGFLLLTPSFAAETIPKYPSKALVAQETLKGHQQNSSRSLL